jgi:peptide/nickel transport system ATP-binding protein
VHAVDGISFDINPSEIFCLAGESGCGKTTIAKVIMGLIKPLEGKIIIKGQRINFNKKNELKQMRRKVQMIYQDPYESLNPKMRVSEIIAEPLEVYKIAKSDQEKKMLISDSMTKVGLIPIDDLLNRFPGELSGGQRQRVAIAAAIVSRPELIIADEPASMLDASNRVEILNMIIDLKERLGVSFLFITHDLAMARYIGNRIAVMYLGKIVESGPVEKIVGNPLHPYAKALISIVPVPNPQYIRKRIILSGEVPDAIKIPTGCRFNPRCPFTFDLCKKEEPALVEVEDGHLVACHLLSHS